MKVEETRYEEIVPVYRAIHKACTDVTEGIIKLSELNIVDEDIQRINALDIEASKELFLLSDDLNYFKENMERMFEAVI